MSTRHSQIVPFTVDDADVLAEVEYNYTKGSPAVMYQRNGDPGWPADPPEIEVLSIQVKHKEVPDWLFDLLVDGDFYQRLFDKHEEPEREYERD